MRKREEGERGRRRKRSIGRQGKTGRGKENEGGRGMEEKERKQEGGRGDFTELPPIFHQRQHKLFQPGQSSFGSQSSPENNLMLILNFFKINKVSL